MPGVGQIEKKTQERELALLSQRLGYTYLGDWIDRPANSNIEPERLKAWLATQGVSDALAARALFELQKAAFDTSKSLYDRNDAVYRLLRYGVKVRPEAGENTITVWLVKWADPLANDFAVAEEVTVPGGDLVSGAKASTKRPDVVLYVNGIALGVLELKRSTVSVSEGIRQNLDNQKKEFIQPFFSTMQWVMAGNDTEGLRYAAIETPEKYWLSWRLGMRQSMPSNSMDNCAGVSATPPELACGHTKRPRCRRLASSIRPWPSNHSTLRMSPRRPRKTKTWPQKGLAARALCATAARPSKPFPMSVWPATIHTRVFAGRPITARCRASRPAPCAASWQRRRRARGRSCRPLRSRWPRSARAAAARTMAG